MLLIFSNLYVISKHISMDVNKDYKLVKIYCYVCEKYSDSLQWQCQRFSNNRSPKLTDQEIITIYLFAMHYQGIFKIKNIHRFAVDYLLDWFPELGSYQAFNNRLNRVSPVMNSLVESLCSDFAPDDIRDDISVVDSMPIITCSGKRRAKVAREIADKGYCSTKGMYYYGMKLHALGAWRPGSLPHPQQILFTPASVNDLALFKEAWSGMKDRVFFGDKIYNDRDFFRDMYQRYGSEMLTPVKAVKGMAEVLRKFDRAANDLYSRAVSRVRQPIESLFNWLIEKADIQMASKVRSTKGLTLFAYGRLAAAFITLIF